MHRFIGVISILFLGVAFCEPFPKVLHQIWISHQDIPPKWESARRAWISLHPTWKHKLWNETQCRDLISSRYQWFLEQWKTHQHPLQRTEVCRFFVLHNYGGMYADLNVRPRRSLDSILQSQEYNSKQIVLLEDEQTAIFASRAKSPFWDEIFAMIGERHQWGQYDGSSLIGVVARRDQSRVGTFPSQNFPRICDDCETPQPSNPHHWITIEPGHHPSTSHVSRLLSSFYRKVLKPLFSVYTLLAMFFAVMTYLLIRRIRQGSHSKHHQTHQRRKVWILLVSFALILIITLPISGTAQSALRGNPDGEKVAFITAHPDDESMFFVPSIRGTLEQHNDLYLLCLSNGNAQGLGATREPELMSAAQLLGFKHVHVMNHPDLQDGPQRKWDVDLIAGIVEEYVKNHTITTIITFDHMGVSGHPNHIAVSNGVKQVLAKREGQLQVYQLRSVNRLEKFSGILDIIPSALSNSDLLFLRSPVLAWQAMARHYSQFVWFRKLFVIFSRYTYINTLVQIRL